MGGKWVVDKIDIEDNVLNLFFYHTIECIDIYFTVTKDGEVIFNN